MIPSLFFLGDSHIQKESYLEDINNILNNCDVMQILNNEDVDELVQDLKQQAKEQGLSDSREKLLKLLVENVKQNLNIIMIFSPVGDKLRNRIRQVYA